MSRSGAPPLKPSKTVVAKEESEETINCLL